MRMKTIDVLAYLVHDDGLKEEVTIPIAHLQLMTDEAVMQVMVQTNLRDNVRHATAIMLYRILERLNAK